MRVALPILAALLLAGCRSDDTTRAQPGQVRTIQQEHLPRATIDDGTPSGETPANETAVLLPFEPPISMDPVDGSKVALRADTPSLEYGGKIYHFSSPETLERFRENPKKYLSGSLATY